MKKVDKQVENFIIRLVEEQSNGLPISFFQELYDLTTFKELTPTPLIEIINRLVEKNKITKFEYKDQPYIITKTNYKKYLKKRNL
jgi:hypothetical protein